MVEEIQLKVHGVLLLEVAQIIQEQVHLLALDITTQHAKVPLLVPVAQTARVEIALL